MKTKHQIKDTVPFGCLIFVFLCLLSHSLDSNQNGRGAKWNSFDVYEKNICKQNIQKNGYELGESNSITYFLKLFSPFNFVLFGEAVDTRDLETSFSPHGSPSVSFSSSSSSECLSSPIRVAIVGGGISGGSAAYFLRRFYKSVFDSSVFSSVSTSSFSADSSAATACPPPQLIIDVYEKESNFGGRMKSKAIAGQEIELCATVLVSSNRYMKHFAKILNLPVSKLSRNVDQSSNPEGGGNAASRENAGSAEDARYAEKQNLNFDEEGEDNKISFRDGNYEDSSRITTQQNSDKSATSFPPASPSTSSLSVFSSSLPPSPLFGIWRGDTWKWITPARKGGYEDDVRLAEALIERYGLLDLWKTRRGVDRIKKKWEKIYTLQGNLINEDGSFNEKGAPLLVDNENNNNNNDNNNQLNQKDDNTYNSLTEEEKKEKKKLQSFRNLGEMLDELKLKDLVYMTGEEGMYNVFHTSPRGRNKINELVDSLTLVNYCQNIGEINFLAACIALAGSSLDENPATDDGMWNIRGGNYQVPEGLIKKYANNFYLNTDVQYINKIKKKKTDMTEEEQNEKKDDDGMSKRENYVYEIYASSSSSVLSAESSSDTSPPHHPPSSSHFTFSKTYDAVIIATPQGIKIKEENNDNHSHKDVKEHASNDENAEKEETSRKEEKEEEKSTEKRSHDYISMEDAYSNETVSCKSKNMTIYPTNALKKRLYKTVYATFVIAKSYDGDYFHQRFSCNVPEEILTVSPFTSGKDITAPFKSIGLVGRVDGNRHKHDKNSKTNMNIYKIFSSEKLPDELINELFKNVSYVYVHKWKAYPVLTPFSKRVSITNFMDSQTISDYYKKINKNYNNNENINNDKQVDDIYTEYPFALKDENIYVTSSFEFAFSCMEGQAVSGANAAALLIKDIYFSKQKTLKKKVKNAQQVLHQPDGLSEKQEGEKKEKTTDTTALPPSSPSPFSPLHKQEEYTEYMSVYTNKEIGDMQNNKKEEDVHEL